MKNIVLAFTAVGLTLLAGVDAVLTGNWAIGTQRFSAREKQGLHCFSNGTVLLFGGRAAEGKKSDLWTGSQATTGSSTWTWAESHNAGDITGREAMTLHYVSNAVYVFGGRTDLTNGVNDLWTISDSRWSLIATSSSSLWPLGRYRHQGVSLSGGDSFVVLFGTSVDRLFNDVWMYNTTTLSWSQLDSGESTSAIPEPRFDPCCAERTSTNSIVCFGGTNTTLDTSDVWEFLLDNNTWILHAATGDTPTGRRLAMCSLTDANTLVIWSGYSSSDSANSPGDSAYAINLLSDTWTAVVQTTVPLARDGGIMCQTPTTAGVFLFGGLGGSTQLNDIWQLSTTTNQFTEHQASISLPSPRAEHSAVALGSRMLILFGEGTGGLLQDVWSMDTETEVWTELSYECFFGARKGAAAVGRGNSILVMGGYTSVGVTNELLSFDVESATWRSISTTNSPPGRYHHSAALIETTKLLIVGGITSSSSKTNNMYLLESTTNTWSEVTQSPSAIAARRSFGLIQNPVTGLLVILGGKSSSVLMDRHSVELNKIDTAWYANVTSLASTIGDVGQVQRQYIRSEAAIVGSGRHYMVCGGAISGSFPASEASICYQYDSQLGTNTQMVAMPTAAYFLSGVYIRNTMYIFGGNLITNAIKRSDTYLNLVQRFTFDAPCTSLSQTDDSNCIHCGLGTNGSACTFTPAGYYRAYNATASAPCAAGRFSTLQGAQDQLFCLPCHDGTYNPDDGQSSCKKCPSGFRCPVGTSEANTNSDIQNSTNAEHQPEAYTSPGVPFGMVLQVFGVWAGAMLLVLIVAWAEEVRWGFTINYYIPKESMKYLENIYAKNLPDETGMGQGRGLTSAEMPHALTDVAVLFYEVNAEQAEDMITDELCDELLEFFDYNGCRYLQFLQFKIVICQLFQREVFGALPSTRYFETKKTRPVRRQKLALDALDIFSTRHNFHKIGEPVPTMKTRAGGVLTIMAGLAVLAITTLLIILFFFDNLEETQATLPEVAVDKDITASVAINIRTLGEDKVSKCVEPDTVDTCVSGSLLTLPSGLEVVRGETLPRCGFTSPGYCTMSWRCAVCRFNNLTNTLSFLFGHADWYSTETVVTTSIDAGVREMFGAYMDGHIGQSVVRTVFSPTTADNVLKGYPATVETLHSTPTTWQAPRSMIDVRLLYGTGYHITKHEGNAGNEAPVTELPTHVGVPVDVVFDISTTYLAIERFLKKDPVSVASTILGASSGVLAVVAFMLGRWDWLLKYNIKVHDKEELSDGAVNFVPNVEFKGLLPAPKRKRKFVTNQASKLVKNCNVRRNQAKTWVDTMVKVAAKVSLDNNANTLITQQSLALEETGDFASSARTTNSDFGSSPTLPKHGSLNVVSVSVSPSGQENQHPPKEGASGPIGTVPSKDDGILQSV